MHRLRVSALWLRIAGPFLLFVIAGSLGLAFWLQGGALRESRAVFSALARTNADFIRSAQIPATEQMMTYLGRLLNLRAFLVRDARDLVPPLERGLHNSRNRLIALQPAEGVVSLDSRFEAIAAPVNGGAKLILVRPTEPALSFASRRETALVLGIFWISSVALASVITRGVVRPLRLLSQRLPMIEHDPDAVVPGAERSDEIGQVARAYIAARAQLAEERSRREKAERHAILGRMATGLAHEIHNPLSAIRMHAQLLQSAAGDELPIVLGESIPVLLDETIHIEGLVNQWMFLARPEPPKTSIILLSELVEQVVRSHRARAAHSGVTVSMDVPSELRVDADSRRVSQAVANIFLNAVQAMKREGRLSLSAREAEGKVRLLIRDTGPGLSAEALVRCRELFYSQKEGGMGVGLSVAGEIVEAHGGTLHVGNAPDGGAFVEIILPAAAAVTREPSLLHP